jgi:hypothetical protein
MLILTPYRHPRLQYAVNVVFENYTSDIVFTDDVDVFIKYEGLKLEYDEAQQVAGSFFIPATAVLWNNDIIAHDVITGKWDDLTTLYAGKGSIPFDIFSASFYLISRYEEYLPAKRDSMGRFSAHESIAHRAGFLHSPIIDLWRMKLEAALCAQWPSIKFTSNQFQFISTMDVDSAFAFRYKGWKRTLGGIAKDVLSFRFSNLGKRLCSLAGLRPDDYDTYAYIAEQCSKRNISNIYFFLLADFGTHDKNVPHTSGPLRALIRREGERNEIGIHPGVASNATISILKKEHERLEDILGKSCSKGRQHYLMLKFPETYRDYIEVGIKEDYTMGYADDVGFRAGTCRAFYWFDLERNEQTSLLVHPFAAMDVTLQRYKSLSMEDAMALCKNMMHEVYAVNGTFITLWHNETLADVAQWKGWRQVWGATLDMGHHFMTKKPKA